MTQPPRDGSLSLAALAVQVNALRSDLASLTTKVDVLASTQQEHAAALDAITEIRNQVEQIRDTLTQQDDDAQSFPWFWLTLNGQDRNDRLSELSDWVETVLRAQYSDYLTHRIRPCWPNHPESWWELAWLYQLWSRAYLSKYPSLKEAADWHDRWYPGVVHRLSTVMDNCETTCRRQPNIRSVADSLSR